MRGAGPIPSPSERCPRRKFLERYSRRRARSASVRRESGSERPRWCQSRSSSELIFLSEMLGHALGKRGVDLLQCQSRPVVRRHPSPELLDADPLPLGRGGPEQNSVRALDHLEIGAVPPLEPIPDRLWNDDLAFGGHFCLRVHIGKIRLTGAVCNAHPASGKVSRASSPPRSSLSSSAMLPS